MNDRPAATGDADTLASPPLAIGDADTLASPPLRPDVAGTGQAPWPRAQVETALFGASKAALMVGRFRMLQQIGEGGMGAVYAAYDDRLDRKVAIKLIHPQQLGSPELRERTQREARLLARLSHPNVVHVYEVDEIAGDLFVVMEYLAGPTLRTWIAEPHGWRETLAVLRQAGEGLAAAHAAGIVHRDFKPHNAMFGADRRLRVLDFGLARVGVERSAHGHAAVEGDSELTQSGALLGTPAYMAPEQFEGRPADARSDQFSFCVTLHEALYGQRPFTGRNLSELAAAVLEAKLPDAPPGSKVPAWVRNVLARGLERQPERRFESMRALLDALGKDPALQRPKIAAALGFAVLLGGAAWGFSQQPVEAQACADIEDELTGVWDDARRAELQAAFAATNLSYAPETLAQIERHLDAYAQAWVVARTEACEATQRGTQSSELLDLRMACYDERLMYVREMVDALVHVDATSTSKAAVAIERMPTLARCSDVDALAADLPPPEDAKIAARVVEQNERLVQAWAQVMLGNYKDGLVITHDVVEEAEVLDYQPLEARAWCAYGRALMDNGDYDAARTALETAVDRGLSLKMPEVASEASTLLMFMSGVAQSRVDEARAWARIADPVSRASNSEAQRQLYLNYRGRVESVAGEYERARELIEQSLASANRPVDRATAMIDLGGIATQQGRYDDARAYLERGVSELRALVGPKHPILTKAFHELGSVAWRQSDYDQAIAYYDQALTIAKDAFGPESVYALHFQQRLATLAGEKGDYAGGVRQLRALLPVFERNGDTAKTYGTLGDIAGLEALQGHHEQAREDIDRALVVAEPLLGPENPSRARLLVISSMVASGLGDHQRAYEDGERALAILEAALGRDHVKVAGALTVVAEALIGLGKPEQAIAQLERVLSFQNSVTVDPVHEFAEARLLLARALWDAPVEGGRDRLRARELAQQARKACVDAGPKGVFALADIDAWLATHG